ncbi:hypothetical protein VKT23_010136 [Stygiomarasmius scandens]|uniref:F-box domain-containing protein n=1 Tax=Marasmiellus scandens TaxID=2682957 RepID=A0ABR1JEU0_9AGAR
MSSLLDQPLTLLSLPAEIVEQIIVYSASCGSYSSVSAVSQTCSSLRNVLYSAADTTLWRAIFLTTFDDPRAKERVKFSPLPGSSEGPFSWRKEYQQRIQAKIKLMRMSREDIVEPRSLTQYLQTMSFIVSTSLPQLPDASTESNNIQWISDIFSNGFSKALTERLTSLSPSNTGDDVDQGTEDESKFKLMVLHPDWEFSPAGRKFYRTLLWTGFLPYVPSSLSDHSIFDEQESPVEFTTISNLETGSESRRLEFSYHYHLRSISKTRELETLARLDPAQQRRLARTVAQHRVYNMRYLSKDRHWGPFLPMGLKGNANAGNVDDLDQGDIDQEDSEEHVKGTAKGKNKDGGERGTSLRILREVLDYGIPLDGDEDSSDRDSIDEDYNPPSQDDDSSVSASSDFDIHSILHSPHPDDDTPSSSSTHLTCPHLLFPDYVFLSAARIVVETNLRDILTRDLGPSPALFRPWFTHASARSSTEDLFKKIDDSSIDNQRGGLNLLRMGSAPGFWDGKGTKEGWLRVCENSVQDSVSDEDSLVDGWDWAGVEGKWTRAVTWMDYRDLLEHSLRNISPLASHADLNHHIDDTRRVFHMNLRITGYSKVDPPATTNASTNGDPANAPDELSPLDKLVYALPVIHVEGNFRPVNDNASFGDTYLDTRRITGTVRMVGEGAVWWHLVTSFESGEQEWAMEGVQIGEIGSALGVVGLWTGAEHERGDPIGASWTWRTA